MKQLTSAKVYLLAIASAVVVANAYYIHPIIAPVAADFGVSDGLIGIVPAVNQFALALGIFFLLPLGDRISNRTLTLICVAGQVVSLAVMALAPHFLLFCLASAVLGFFTIAPYILPAYASKRVEQSQLGFVTAVLTTGIIVGILLSRVGSGVLAAHVDWRWVYWIAAVLMVAVSALLWASMDRGERSASDNSESYFTLLASLPGLVRRYPFILISGGIQGLGFGIFLSVWMGLGLHLTSPEMGYGVDVVGYLAAISAINVFVTPRLGAWADKVGARKARLTLVSLQFFGMVTLLFTGHSLWLLMIPLTIMNITGPSVDVTNRMTFLEQAPDVRTRLMTIYIMMMFIGGGVMSWAGTLAYAHAGWTGNAVLAIGLSVVITVLAVIGRRGGTEKPN